METAQSYDTSKHFGGDAAWKVVSGDRREPAAHAFGALAERMNGELLRPGDAGYEANRKHWNGLWETRPAAIALCRSEADVVAAVRFARDNNLPITMGGNGFGISRGGESGEGLMINLSLMRRIEIDADWRVVRVEGGVTWEELDRATLRNERLVPGGGLSHGGIVGHSGEAALGIFHRAFGTSYDHLVAATVVSPEARRVRVTELTDRELFSVIRAGAPFRGVITSLEFRLRRATPRVAAVRVAYPAESAMAVLSAWRSFAEAAPRTVTTSAMLWNVPEVPDLPLDLHGTPFLYIEGYWAGDPREGAEELAPLRTLANPLWDASGEYAYAQARSSLDPYFCFGERYYTEELLFGSLGDEAIDTIIDWAEDRPGTRSFLKIRALGGAKYRLKVEMAWELEAHDALNVRWARSCKRDLARLC